MTDEPAFHVGQLVWMTDEACAQGLQGYALTRFGNVTSVSRLPKYLHVRRDGIATAQRYAACFWEPADMMLDRLAALTARKEG